MTHHTIEPPPRSKHEADPHPHITRRCTTIMMSAVVVMMIFISGCGAPKTSDRDIAFVSTSDAAGLVGRREGVLGIGRGTVGVWVDCRSAAAYRTGHIPGAISVPFETVSNDHDKLNSYDVLIVYGQDYGDPRAVAMSKRLIELGHDDVRTLQGGVRAWTDEGNELTNADE